MKKYFFLIVILFVLSDASAQKINDLVIFCNDGEKFTLVMNGMKYNDVPASSVKATNLKLDKYQTKIIFENPKLRDLNTTITFYNTGMECLFGLYKKSKKEYGIDKDGNCTEINPVAKEPIVEEDNTINNNTSTNNTTDTYNANNTTTNTNTTTPTPTNTNNSNSMSIKVGGVNIGMNDKGGVKLGTKTGDINLNSKDKSGNIVIDDGKDGITLNKVAKIGCTNPMTATDFATIKKSISTQATDTNKVIAANALLDKNCFLTSQVKEIMELFSDDKSKLEFAKSAYPNTNDQSNYYQLKATLTKDESKKELQQFIKEQK